MPRKWLVRVPVNMDGLESGVASLGNMVSNEVCRYAVYPVRFRPIGESPTDTETCRTLGGVEWQQFLNWSGGWWA